MNEPPDHTAELRAANLWSFWGMIVAKYCLTSSSCSRRPESMSRKMTPFDSRSAWSLWYTTSDSYCAPTPARDFFSALVFLRDAAELSLLPPWDPEPVPRVEDLRREVLPLVHLLLGRLQVVVDVVEVDSRATGHPARVCDAGK